MDKELSKKLDAIHASLKIISWVLFAIAGVLIGWKWS